MTPPTTTPTPQFGQVVQLFLDVKNDVLTMITTMMGVIIVITILLLLMILVVKMTKKYTYNMILMSRYKGQLGKPLSICLHL